MELDKTTKGFFFVLATFIVLAYMITSITIWTKSMETAERSYAEKFKISNLDLVVSQISKEKVEKFSDIAAYHALYTINSKSMISPLKRGNSDSRDNEYFYVKQAFWKAMINGTVDNEDFEGEPVMEYETSEKDTYTLTGWFEKLNSTISSIGLEISNYSLEKLDLHQNSIDSLNYTFHVKFIVKDRANLAYITRDYKINGTVNITGLQDPAMFRESDGKIVKQFFFLDETKNSVGPYDKPKDLNPRILKSGEQGQGWFYGPVVAAKDLNSRTTNVNIFERNSTILVGTYDEITNIIGTSEVTGTGEEAEPIPEGKGDPDIDTGQQTQVTTSSEYPHYLDFGAYILTNEPETTGTCDGTDIQDKTFNAIDCDGQGDVVFKTATMIEKPFAVIPGFSVEDVKNYPNVGRRVLFVNKNSPEEIKTNPNRKMNSEPVIYNIEELRDMAVCGYYVKYPHAPSYLQRLFRESYDLNDEEFGMEAFVFGRIIGGDEAERMFTDDRSRLDKEVFSGTDASKIRGMPGCKNVAMCTSNSPIGHFMISTNASKEFITEEYMSKIVCKDETCRGAD